MHFQYSEKFQGNSVFQGKRKWLKILNVKSIFSTVKIFKATLFFRVSASCSKILKDKMYIQCSEHFQGTLCFSGQAQVDEESGM